MSDYEKLRIAAKNAKTRGPWVDIKVGTHQGSSVYKRNYSFDVAEVGHQLDGSYLCDIYYEEDSKYLALADPDTILSILSENELLRRQVVTLSEWYANALNRSPENP